MINARTTLFGLFGDPVAQSLGPAMHNAAFEAMELNAAYLAFAVKDLSGAVAGFRALDMGGASVTIPYKTKVMGLLDAIDPLAAQIGAVNTIVNRNGVLTGYNTDCQGVLDPLEACTGLAGKSVALLGAGGAARAAGFALTAAGAVLTVYNRNPDRGRALAADLGAAFLPLAAFGQSACDILINATCLGMVPQTGTLAVDPEAIGQQTVVRDLVYNPRETRLLAAARAKGCTTIEGLEMFVAQGAAQLALWTAKPAPLDLMRRVVVAALEKGHR